MLAIWPCFSHTLATTQNIQLVLIQIAVVSQLSRVAGFGELVPTLILKRLSSSSSPLRSLFLSPPPPSPLTITSQKAGLAVSSILRIGKLASNNLLSSGTSSSPASSPSSSSSPGTTTTQSASSRKTDQKGGISNGAISLLTSADEGNKMAAPEFVKEMIDVEVLEGDKARFDVKVKGTSSL